MKKSFFKRGASALLAVVMCLSTFLGIGSTTAFAAENTTDEVVMFSFPREGDSNFGGDWGHGELKYMNGWSAASTKKITVYAMLPYLLSLIGVIIALLAAKDSAYVRFHVKQALKILVTTALVGMLTVLLCWTIIAAIAGCVCLIILEVVNFIAFFQVCGNKAKEPPIVKSLSFLK